MARHVLRGVSFAIVTTALISVLGPGSNDASMGQSSMADVYKGELTPLQRHGFARSAVGSRCPPPAPSSSTPHLGPVPNR
nr:unnamed protein product [Digitaria exilis]